MPMFAPLTRLLPALALTLLTLLPLQAQPTAVLAGFTAVDLRCEGLVDPLGIDVAAPRLSWRMAAANRGAAQTAYQILCATEPGRLRPGEADLWDSGKISGNQSQHIRYAGKTLARGIPHHWAVRIWNEAGEASAWSPPSSWTFFDLARSADWQASWITEGGSSPWLRRAVTLKTAPARAHIYVNALGYFHLFINGRRVGRDEFAPHVGQFDRRTVCLTYDVAAYLQPGENVIALWLGSGWSQGGAGVQTTPSVRAQLEVVDADGARQFFGTDPTWRAKPSSLSYLGKWKWNQFGGEVHDARLDEPTWAELGYDDTAWPAALPAELPDMIVSAEVLQRNRVVETITPVAITRVRANIEAGQADEAGEAGEAWLVDMGKAMTGTFEITFPAAPSGHRILMEFGDSWTPDGQGGVAKINSFNQRSEYIAHGHGRETFRQRFNYASCRYILIRNAPPGDLAPQDIQGHFITLDLPRAGTFHSSDETLNGIHRMMEHTLRCLMLGGYQVDCHSRERYGYGGDGHSSLDTTLSLMRSDAFYRKWTLDWLDGQTDDGGFSYTSPTSRHGGGPFWSGFLTAATLKHYHHYGDRSLVERNYPAIKKWFELAQSKTANDQQQKFSGGWYLGDWASPEGIDDKKNAEVFIQSYMAYALKQAAQLAEVLGRSDDAQRFREWAQARNVATHQAFYRPEEKVYGSGDQVTFILPLIAGTVPHHLRDQVFAEFEKTLTTTNAGHLSTGLSGTYLMIQYLQSIGRDDLIYLFASKQTFPSWGYMIAQGATATWEHWNGRASRIHNCYNNIGSWFIQGLAGIRPDPKSPGFQNALIMPAFLPQLSHVNGSHDTLHGTLVSNWRREGGGTIVMDVQIPANTTATIHVPAEDAAQVTIDGHPISETKHVTFRGIEGGRVVLEAAAGSYQIRVSSPGPVTVPQKSFAHH